MGISIESLFDCSTLEEINVNSNNPSFCVSDGVLYDKEKTSLLAIPYSKTGNLIIKQGVSKLKVSVLVNSSLEGATFGNPNGWALYKNGEMIEEISSSLLSNSNSTFEYLKQNSNGYLIQINN